VFSQPNQIEGEKPDDRPQMNNCGIGVDYLSSPEIKPFQLCFLMKFRRLWGVQRLDVVFSRM